MYHVYVLHSPVYDKIYIGYSSDVGVRFIYHNQGPKKGWSSRYRPWYLIWLEAYQGKKEAMIRERQLKSARGRRWIREELIRACWV
ncbi:GIY-YIG nuclease family protein [Rhodohalobacter mucosus]|uniref:Endonuclease n=1 Tax=Rhodohalobacter mucosus TaxID=2079485 RepID=A0A316TW68_9BACT|nr:GIY-YIG nuclease family protein [Rhodohalobacter mucosus]PWN06774.1 endonuclease [Rhodohalobacter mucosus]